jgi:hypothetical protein
MLRSLLDKHATLRVVKICQNRSAPWYDVGCGRFKARTRRWERALRAPPSDIAQAELRSHFKQQRQLLQSNQANYWTQFNLVRRSTKALWRKLHFVVTNYWPAPGLSAEEFANYFMSKVTDIRWLTGDMPSPFIHNRSVNTYLL